MSGGLDLSPRVRRIPHWQEAPFADLLSEPVRNGVYRSKEFHGRGAKMVNMGELFAHPRLADVPMKRVELDEAEKHRFGVRRGDLLFARRSLVAEGAGKCCVVLEAPEPTAFESSIIRARPDPAKADSLFLYYYFNSPAGLHGLDSIRRQVAVAGITGTDLANLKLLLPPLPEQRTIVQILGSLDDKIELNRRMKETLEAMARALFKSWFVDFEPVRAKMEGRDTGLPERITNLFPNKLAGVSRGGQSIPIGWSTVPLSEVAHFLNGLALQKYPMTDAEQSLPVIKIAELRNGVTAKTARASNAVPTQYIINDGDFLFSWSGSLIAKFWTGGPGALNQHLFKVTSSDYPSWFFTHWVQHHLPTFREIAAGKATTMGHIQRHHVAEAKTVCPTSDVLQTLDPIMSALLRRAINVQLENRTIARIRDELLPKLISGEIRAAQAERAVEAVIRSANA